MKHDDGKPRFDLIPAIPMFKLAEVYKVGAGEYGDRNWEKGIAYGRVFAALMRHLWAWWAGEQWDREDNLQHLAHAAWNVFALLEYTNSPARYKEFDDRNVEL